MARAASAHRTAGAPAGAMSGCLAARDAACHTARTPPGDLTFTTPYREDV
jgi:hypothetical protein